MKDSTKQFLFVVFLGLVMALVYSIIDAHPPKNVNPEMVRRRIETPMKLWFNGYLGSFFNYFAVGNLNWLSLLAIPWYVFSQRKLERWKKAFLTFLVLSTVIIGVGGYFNARYQLTLMPLFLGTVLYIFDSLSVTNKNKKKYIGVMLICALLNFSFYFYSNFWLKYQSRIVTLVNNNVGSNSLISTIDFLDTLGISSSDAVLVNAMPEFYYYTNIKGVYYQSLKDIYYTTDGPKRLFHGRTDNDVVSFLKDSLHCSYLYSYKGLHIPNNPFTNFLTEKAILMKVDVSGREVYKLKD